MTRTPLFNVDRLRSGGGSPRGRALSVRNAGKDERYEDADAVSPDAAPDGARITPLPPGEWPAEIRAALAAIRPPNSPPSDA